MQIIKASGKAKLLLPILDARMRDQGNKTLGEIAKEEQGDIQ